VTGRVLTGPEMNAHNTFDLPDAVRPEAFHGASMERGAVKLTLPARSVVMLEISG
jgi:alpha-L-arabinofuranosidase